MREIDQQPTYAKNISNTLIDKFNKYYKVAQQNNIKIINFDTNKNNSLSEKELINGISFMQQALFTQNYNLSMLPKEEPKSYWDNIKNFFLGKKEEPLPKLNGHKRINENKLIFFEHQQSSNGLEQTIIKDDYLNIIKIKNYYEPTKNTIKCETKTPNGENLNYEIYNLADNSKEIGIYKNNILEKIIKNNSDGSSCEEIYTSSRKLTQKIIKDKNNSITKIYEYDKMGNEIKTTSKYRENNNFIEEETTKNATKKTTYDLNNIFIKSEEFKQIDKNTTMKEYKYADGKVIRINNDNLNQTTITKIKYPEYHNKSEEQNYSNEKKGLHITSILYSDGREEESHFYSKNNQYKEIKRFPSGEQQIFYYTNGHLNHIIKYDNTGIEKKYKVINENLIEVNP